MKIEQEISAVPVINSCRRLAGSHVFEKSTSITSKEPFSDDRQMGASKDGGLESRMDEHLEWKIESNGSRGVLGWEAVVERADDDRRL